MHIVTLEDVLEQILTASDEIADVVEVPGAPYTFTMTSCRSALSLFGELDIDTQYCYISTDLNEDRAVFCETLLFEKLPTPETFGWVIEGAFYLPIGQGGEQSDFEGSIHLTSAADHEAKREEIWQAHRTRSTTMLSHEINDRLASLVYLIDGTPEKHQQEIADQHRPLIASLARLLVAQDKAKPNGP